MRWGLVTTRRDEGWLRHHTVHRKVKRTGMHAGPVCAPGPCMHTGLVCAPSPCRLREQACTQARCAYLVLVVPAEVHRPPHEQLAFGGSLVQGIIVHLRDALKPGHKGGRRREGSHKPACKGGGLRDTGLHAYMGRVSGTQVCMHMWGGSQGYRSACICGGYLLDTGLHA